MSTTAAEDYLLAFSDFIRRQLVIVGPTVAMSVVSKVPGLAVEVDGRVTSVGGDPVEISNKLKEEFGKITGIIAERSLQSAFSKYPSIALQKNA